MIICAGEALIDMIPVTGENGEATLKPVSGGAIFNTAIGLGRLGVDVAMVTGLSRDLFGRQLERDLIRSGVSTEFITFCDRPTTLAFLELTDGSATYHFYDENTAGRLLKNEDIKPTPDTASAWYFGGISLCALPAANTYADLAAAQAENAVIMIDPNIRPSFIEDETAYRARMSRLCGFADIIKCSDEDLDWLIPRETDERERVSTFIESVCCGIWPALLVITRGGDGLTLYRKGQPGLTVPATHAKVVDTVGAGDTFNAGLLARLSEKNLLNKTDIRALTDEDTLDALTFAAKVAAVTVSRQGANPPWREEL